MFMVYKLTISCRNDDSLYASKVKTGGYGTVSEYIRELVRLDQRIEFARADSAQRQQSVRPSVSDYPMTYSTRRVNIEAFY